jgi:glycosyltransferase involved in cell wall biosynthesis
VAQDGLVFAYIGTNTENMPSVIALAHHWLVTARGGESVLAQFHLLFPDAPIATLVYRRDKVSHIVLGSQVIRSPLQKVPCAARFYKVLLPAHAWAFNRLKVPANTKIVLSSDASMVKGLRLPAGAKQVCYCHSPPRYLWDMQDVYVKNARNLGMIGRAVFRWTVPRARRFDYASAQRVDRFVGNSAFVAERIKRCYDREADVIHPPVDVNAFESTRIAENFYLIVGQLAPYKRVDLAITSFNRLKLPLVIIGEGSELASLRKLAGPSVRLLGWQPFNVIKDHFERCRAFLYPQIEDFGITAVEAQAAGRPVIAYRAGGALESVVEGQTGAFFDEQTPESLIEAVRVFEAEWRHYQPDMCRKNAERFGPKRFRSEIKALLCKYYPETFRDYVWPV